MKKLLFVFILILALILTGCGGVSDEDHNAVVTERDQLKTQLAELQADYDALAAELNALQDLYAPTPAGDAVSELRALTETWLEGEFHRVYDQYYDIQSLEISNWHEDGNEATFFYKMTWLNYNRDPDTVDYIKKAKENNSPNYEKIYQEYLGEHEANFEFKIVLEGDELVLYSNVSPKGVNWEPTKVDDYVMR